MSLLPISKPVAETPLASPVATDWRPASAGEAGESVTDPAVIAYTAWVEALTTHERLSDEHDEMRERLGVKHPDSAAKFAEYQEALEKLDQAEEAFEEATPSTPAGVLARFAIFTYWSSNCMYPADVQRWQGSIGDIARLGILPLARDVAAFGEGRYFGALHRAAMSKEGIDPPGRPVTLPSSLWEPTVEQAGVVYPLPVGVALDMKAEEQRIRIENAQRAMQAPEKAQARTDRVLTAFREVPDAQQDAVLRWLEFGATGSHLHAATLRFAQANGWLDEYRDRLVRQLEAVGNAQFQADLNDLPAPIRSAWTGLIRAAARGEGFEEAVEAFRRVERADGVSPDVTEKAIALTTNIHRRRAGFADADLLAAFDEWAALTRQMDAVGVDEAVSDTAYEKSKVPSAVLETVQPQSMTGVAAVLRYLFAKRGEGAEHYDAAVNGTEPNELALSDYRDRLLWQTIQAVERMAEGSKRKASE